MDRKRKSALTGHELSVLIDLLESRPDLISGKLGGSYANIAAVKTAWEELASQLSVLGSGVIRSGPELKKKWIDLKYRTKRKASELNQAAKQTGGGPPLSQKLSDIELRILSLIGTTCVEGVCGLEFDSMYVQLKATFGIGVYAGIYICQNYQVPRVDEPGELWRKVREFAEQYKKPPEN